MKQVERIVQCHNVIVFIAPSVPNNSLCTERQDQVEGIVYFVICLIAPSVPNNCLCTETASMSLTPYHCRFTSRKAVWEMMGIPPETRIVLEREERENKGGRVIRGNGIFAQVKIPALLFLCIPLAPDNTPKWPAGLFNLHTMRHQIRAGIKIKLGK